MLPGVAPPGREPPGRGGIPPGPGRGPPGPPGPPGPCGLGIAGRSTGCTEENGLLPTRGGRGMPGLGAAGPGRGPGAAGRAGAWAGAAAAGAAGAGGATGVGGAGTGAAGPGRGPGAAGIGEGATGVAATGAAAAGVAATGGADTGAAAAAGAFGGAFSGALPPPNDSRSRRATGASTVDDADLTNSPCSLRRARTSLLVTPRSFANSCTRALPGAATTSPTQEATAVGGPRLGFSYDESSSELHGVLMFFATCFCRRGRRAFPRSTKEVLDHRGCVR